MNVLSVGFCDSSQNLGLRTMARLLIFFVFASTITQSQSQSASQLYQQFLNKPACDALPGKSCHLNRQGLPLQNITNCAEKNCCQARTAKHDDFDFVCCANVANVSCIDFAASPAIVSHHNLSQKSIIFPLIIVQ